MFETIVGLRYPRARKCVRLANVGTGFKVAPMNLVDHGWLRQLACHVSEVSKQKRLNDNDLAAMLACACCTRALHTVTKHCEPSRHHMQSCFQLPARTWTWTNICNNSRSTSHCCLSALLGAKKRCPPQRCLQIDTISITLCAFKRNDENSAVDQHSTCCAYR